MIDAVAVIGVVAVLAQAQTAVVFHLDTEVFGFSLRPEIQATRYFPVGLKRRVVRVVGMDRVVEIDKRERVAPAVGVEEFHRRGYAVGALVLTRCTQTAEIIEKLQISACLRTQRKQTHTYYKQFTLHFLPVR